MAWFGTWCLSSGSCSCWRSTKVCWLTSWMLRCGGVLLLTFSSSKNTVYIPGWGNSVEEIKFHLSILMLWFCMHTCTHTHTHLTSQTFGASEELRNLARPKIIYAEFVFSFFTVVQLQLSPFIPHYSPLPCPPPPPHSILPTVVFVHGSFIHVSWLDCSPFFPHYPPSPSSLVAVSLFFIVL